MRNSRNRLSNAAPVHPVYATLADIPAPAHLLTTGDELLPEAPSKRVNKGGRPSLYKPEHCARVIELGFEGKSLAQMARELGVRRETLYEWQARHPDFKAAMNVARDYALAAWEDKGEQALHNPRFDSNLYARIMAARFPGDYSDHKRVEVSGPGGGPVELAPVEVHLVG